MDPMRRVRDFMIPVDRYPSIRDRATLREAISAMQGTQLEVRTHKSLPRVVLVFDEIQVLVGYVRRRDIMQGLEPKFLATQTLNYRKKLFDVAVDPNLSELSHDRVVKAIREQAERPVSDVMSPIETVIEADDHLMKAVYEMVSEDLALIPVVDQGELVGVIRSVDVFDELTKLLE